MNRIKFDSNCNGCKLCFKACWLDVIRWDEANKKPVEAYPEDCVDCLMCEVACPQKAVHVIIDFEKPMPKSY